MGLKAQILYKMKFLLLSRKWTLILIMALMIPALTNAQTSEKKEEWKPVQEFNLQQLDFGEVIRTALVNSKENTCLIAIIASDDKAFTDMVVQVMNGTKATGSKRLAIINATKPNGNLNSVTLVANGHKVELYFQTHEITGSSGTYKTMGTLSKKILEGYKEHVKPYI